MPNANGDGTSLFDAAPTQNVVVRFRVPGPAKIFENPGTELKRGDPVVVRDGAEEACGIVTRASPTGAPPLGQVVRTATAQDAAITARNAEREAAALVFCRERVRALGLSMKLVAVELSHDATHAVFQFSAAERVDFRVLIKDLARHLRLRVEMRQIGVRDASRHTGGTGICGRSLCCSSWLPEFQPISIRMAKDQNLALNQQKLSGLCGRLRCCLQYEQETYQRERKTLPKVGKRVHTERGIGRVRDVNVLRRIVRIELEAGGLLELTGPELEAITDVGSPSPTLADGAAKSPAGKSKNRRRKRKRKSESTDGATVTPPTLPRNM